MTNAYDDEQSSPSSPSLTTSGQSNSDPSQEALQSDANWADPTLNDSDVIGRSSSSANQPAANQPAANQPAVQALDYHPPRLNPTDAPVQLVETAFLASTTGLLWLISYYLSISPWMRIFFPIPIALAYLRWGQRAAWMGTIVTCLLLSILMGPYLSLLFLMPYGLLGVQLGFLWQRKAKWSTSILLGSLISTISFFMRVALLSAFLGEDLWAYVNSRITDFLEWGLTILVNMGIADVGLLGRPDILLVQCFTLGTIFASDMLYLFTVHIAAWVLLNRLGSTIPDPPEWVQVLLEE